MMIRYSDKYKGAWIYRTIPIKDAAPIFKGTLKSFIVRLLLPIYAVECIVFIVIFGIRILPDLVLVFLSMLLFTTICFMVFRKSFPFSEAYEAAQQGDGLIAIPLMLVLGVFAGIHYASTLINHGVYVYIAVMIIIDIIVWNKIFNISWNKITN